jgi:glycosyltransferase involved in cell wall biosynthesis
MKICIVSKFPPIEGQVANVNYWLARGLALRGDHVRVITNAAETPPSHRCEFTETELAALGIPETPAGGSLRITNTGALGDKQYHIPYSNPFVSKLASLTLDAIAREGCDVLFSHYIEPYGIAAGLASMLSGVPHVMTHSGSDIARLLNNPNFSTLHRAMIARATVFVAKNHLAQVDAPSVRTAKSLGLEAFAPSQEIFRPDGPVLDIPAAFARWGNVPDRPALECNFDPSRPTIGIYGKLVTVKGIFDLVEAVARLRDSGLDANLVVIGRWRRDEEVFHEAVQEADLVRLTTVLPFLPNTLIPQFLRACDVVAYLERKWPSPLHTTIVPREILAVGRPLVVSGEIAANPLHADTLVDGENCLVVPDPTDAPQLEATLHRSLRDSALRARLTEGALRTARHWSQEGFVDGWRRLLMQAAGASPCLHAWEQSDAGIPATAI